MDDLLQLLESLPNPPERKTQNNSIDTWIREVTFVETIGDFPQDSTTRNPTDTWLQQVTFFNPSKHFPHIEFRRKKKKCGSLMFRALAARYRPEFLEQANLIRYRLVSDYMSRQANNYWTLSQTVSTSIPYK